MYITESRELRELVAVLRRGAMVGVDTEFMRERTYFARLCLVQLANEDVSAIVDPLAVDDLTPLCDLLHDPGVVKVFHAGGQDLEIFYRACGIATTPVFDTQVAATLAGFPQQVGYGALVQELLGTKLDKGDTYTDWARRPLSDTQVEYALNDVRYLPEIHRLLTDRLGKEGRLGWLEKDFSRMEDPGTYTVEPRDQWRRVKRVASLNRRQLAIAREVAAWRELEAMRRDVPKRWILGDESVVEVARRAPTTVEALLAVRGVGDKLGKAAAAGLVRSVASGAAASDDELPFIEKRRRVPRDVDGAVDLMVALVRLRARENGVAMPLLASRDDLERLAAGEREGHALLGGWRAGIVGNEVLDLLEGRIELRLEDGELVVSRRVDERGTALA